MTPYWDFPQLLSLLMRLLCEVKMDKLRCEIMKVLGECLGWPVGSAVASCHLEHIR
jgi:hypothetical protein